MLSEEHFSVDVRREGHKEHILTTVNSLITAIREQICKYTGVLSLWFMIVKSSKHTALKEKIPVPFYLHCLTVKNLTRVSQNNVKNKE